MTHPKFQTLVNISKQPQPVMLRDGSSFAVAPGAELLDVPRAEAVDLVADFSSVWQLPVVIEDKSTKSKKGS